MNEKKNLKEANCDIPQGVLKPQVLFTYDFCLSKIALYCFSLIQYLLSAVGFLRITKITKTQFLFLGC